MKIKNLKVLDLFKWKGNWPYYITTKHKDIGNFLLSLLKNNVNMINNAAVTKMNTLLQPLMHNHSTLCLTIGSGLIVVGFWWLYINIWSLLARLGIFANNNFNQTPQTVNTGSIIINKNNIIPSENTVRVIVQGVFRQLGVKVLKCLVIIYIKTNKDIIMNLTDVQHAALVFVGMCVCSLLGLILIKEEVTELIIVDEITKKAKFKSLLKNMDQESIDPITLINVKKNFEVTDNDKYFLFISLFFLEGFFIFSACLSYEEYNQTLATYKKWLKAKSLKQEDGLQ